MPSLRKNFLHLRRLIARTTPWIAAFAWLTMAGYAAQTYTVGIHHAQHAVQKMQGSARTAAVLDSADCAICDALQTSPSVPAPFTGGQPERRVAGSVAAQVMSRPAVAPERRVQPRAPPAFFA